MASAPAIGFEYRPSRLIQRLRWSVAGLASLALMLSGMDLPVRVLLAFALVAGIGLAQWRRAPSPTAVGWHPKSGWTVRMADGRDAAMILRSFRVLAGCIVLNLAGEGMRHDLWLLPDNSDPDTRRRLRMRLAATGGEAVSLR
jgi:toxin CptA